MPKHKLVLNVGDRVRNINKASTRCGMVGRVNSEGPLKYYVVYDKGVSQVYYKDMVHMYLEKVEEHTPACGCIHDELCDVHARQTIKAWTLAQRYGAGVQTIAQAMGRTVLKKVRRNVITGKTQDEMMERCGRAVGAVQFNKRALGITTGQAFACISEAMVNPGKPVRLWEKDHAIWDESVSTPSNLLNKHFVSVVESLIEKNKLVGFHFDLPKQFMTYHPIVTEETYVTRSN